jgi:hypothetical protein
MNPKDEQFILYSKSSAAEGVEFKKRDTANVLKEIEIFKWDRYYWSSEVKKPSVCQMLMANNIKNNR